VFKKGFGLPLVGAGSLFGVSPRYFPWAGGNVPFPGPNSLEKARWNYLPWVGFGGPGVLGGWGPFPPQKGVFPFGGFPPGVGRGFKFFKNFPGERKGPFPFGAPWASEPGGLGTPWGPLLCLGPQFKPFSPGWAPGFLKFPLVV